MERKRIIVLSYEVTLFGILHSNEGTTFLETGWQMGRSSSENKTIRNKYLNFYLLNHLHIPKNSVLKQPRTSDGEEEWYQLDRVQLLRKEGDYSMQYSGVYLENKDKKYKEKLPSQWYFFSYSVTSEI